MGTSKNRLGEGLLMSTHNISFVEKQEKHMSQRTTNSTIRLVRPAKTKISLRTRAVWSESSLIAYAFYSLQAIQRGINENPCYTEWMYRLIGVFACHTGVIVGFVMR